MDDDLQNHEGVGANPDGISDRIVRVIRGDNQALEWLVEWLSPLMITWARSQLNAFSRAIADPEDLVQDVWIKILPRLGKLQPHPQTGRWTPAVLGLVKTTLVHRIIDIRRTAARQRMLNGAPDQPHSPAANSSSGPCARALRSERRRQVQRALDGLGERERQLYVKRLFEGTSIPELAAEFRMTGEAVIKARQRARKRLEGLLAPQLLDALEPE